MSQDAASTALSMARGGKKKIKVHKGPIHSTVAGRTDHLPMHVASGSYVIPADIISAMGEGNSMAGFKVAKSIFSVSGPYDQGSGMPYGGGEMPYGQPVPHKAGGGGADSGRAANRPATSAPAPRPSPQASSGVSPGRPTSTSAAPVKYDGLWDRINGGGPGAGFKNVWDTINGGGMGHGYTGLRDMINGGGMEASSTSGSDGRAHVARSQAQQVPEVSRGPNIGGVIGGLVGGPVGYLAGSMLTGRATGPADFINGGGLGASDDTFKGGPMSGAMNMLGVTPYASGKAGGGQVAGQMDLLGTNPYSTPAPVGAGQHAMGTQSPTGVAAQETQNPQEFFRDEFKNMFKTMLDPRDRAAGKEALPTFARNLANYKAQASSPQPQQAPMSTGGHVHDGDAVPIVAAGGEYVIPPEDVQHLGNGSLEDGHKILDAFVKKMRKKTIRTLQSLPGPKKD